MPNNMSEFAQAVLALEEQRKAVKLQQQWAQEQHQAERERWDAENKLLKTQLQDAQLRQEEQLNQILQTQKTRQNETALLGAWSEMVSAQEAMNLPGERVEDQKDSLGMSFRERRLETATKRFADARDAAVVTPGAFATLFTLSEGLAGMQSMPENVRLTQAKTRAEIANLMGQVSSRGEVKIGEVLEAEKKTMDLRFDGMKILEQEVAPEKPEDIRKRWQDSIQGTQDTGAVLAANINQLVSTLALNPETPESAVAVANTLSGTSRKLESLRSSKTSDVSAISSAAEEMYQQADLFSNRIIVRPNTVQDQQLRQLRQNIADYRSHATALINQRRDMDDEIADTNLRLQMAHSLYSDNVDVLRMSPTTAARDAARRVRDVFDVAAPAMEELRMSGAYTIALRPGASQDEMNAALTVIRSKAQKYTKSTTDLGIVTDILTKDLMRQKGQRYFQPRPPVPLKKDEKTE